MTSALNATSNACADQSHAVVRKAALLGARGQSMTSIGMGGSVDARAFIGAEISDGS
jgi:hypothetical protein